MSRLHDNKKRDRIYHHPCTAAVDHIMTEIVLCPLYYNDAIYTAADAEHSSELRTDRVRYEVKSLIDHCVLIVLE